MGKEPGHNGHLKAFFYAKAQKENPDLTKAAITRIVRKWMEQYAPRKKPSLSRIVGRNRSSSSISTK